MPSPFLRSDKTLIKIAQGYIDDGFVHIPDDEYGFLLQSGINVKRLRLIMTKLLQLNKAVDDVGNLPIRGDPVIRDIVGIEERRYRPGKPGTRNTGGSEYRKLVEEFEDMPFAIPASRRRLLRAVEALQSEWQDRLRPRSSKSPIRPPVTGSSSFGIPMYITVNGRKRRLYRGLYGGVYYKNTTGKKIYLKLKMKMKIKIKKNKVIKSADGISVTGWKNILDFYENSNHKITWVHSPTRVLKMVKMGDMIEFTVKTDDSGEMYDKYLDIIVSPDDDGNYPVSIDGKKYLVSGNGHDAKNTFSYVHGAPSAFDPGRSWYVYKFKTRINLTEV